MFDIIKTIEKKTNSFSNKLNTGIKEKILANEIPRTTYILAYIIWTLCLSFDIFFEKMPYHQLISNILLATTITVYIPYTSLKFSKKILSFIAVYAVSISMYIAEYFCKKNELPLPIFSISLYEALMIGVLIVILILSANIKFTLADEAFKQNLLTSFKYSFIICFSLLFAASLFIVFIIPDSKFTINSDIVSDIVCITVDFMLLVELITLYVIEKKFEKGLKCDDEEEEE
jgi:hypothetical protein